VHKVELNHIDGMGWEGSWEKQTHFMTTSFIKASIIEVVSI